MFVVGTAQSNLRLLQSPYIVPGPGWSEDDIPLDPFFFDSFDRANNNLEVSNEWSHDNLISGALAIRSNNLSCLTTDVVGSAYKCINQGSADHYVEYTVANITTNTGAFVCNRLTNRNNFIGVRNLGTVIQVFRRDAGTLTQLYSVENNLILGDVVRLECEGTIVSVFKNGSPAAGTSSGSLAGTQTSSDQGVVGRSVVTDPWIRDFTAGIL